MVMDNRAHTASFFTYLEYEKRFSPHTLSAYRTDLKQFERYLLDVYELDDPAQATHQHIRSWLVSLLAGGLSGRSLRRKAASLRSFFRFLRKREILTQDPMRKVETGKLSRRLPPIVRQEEMERLFAETPFPDSFSGKRDMLILELLYGTGMRRAELLGLYLEDIQWEVRQVRVRGKGGKERLIPLGTWLLEHLRQYVQVRAETFGPARDRPLFLTGKGKPLYPKRVYLIVREYLARVSQAERKSPHVLRHAFATHLLEQGADLQAVKDLLGHTSLAATQVYTHNTIEQLKKTYQRAHPKARKKGDTD